MSITNRFFVRRIKMLFLAVYYMLLFDVFLFWLSALCDNEKYYNITGCLLIFLLLTLYFFSKIKFVEFRILQDRVIVSSHTLLFSIIGLGKNKEVHVDFICLHEFKILHSSPNVAYLKYFKKDGFYEVINLPLRYFNKSDVLKLEESIIQNMWGM